MKNTAKGYIIRLRHAVQLAFLGLSVFIGYRFYHFVYQFVDPALEAAGAVIRPPSVDAYLPISGIMATKYYLFTGIIEPMHPAGMFSFIAIALVSLVAKKGFCGWICPFGTISEVIWRVSEKLRGRRLGRPALWADISLRSLKYLLMVLILFIITAMTPNMMVLFFITDYYKTVDVSMLMMFVNVSTLTLVVFGVIIGLSFFLKNFWCRYLCPYGALLGLMSRLSPLKVHRDADKCIGCQSCTRNCPSLIEVHKQETVSSAECLGCMTCVGSCPEDGALDMTVKAGGGRRAVRPYVLPAVVVVAFYAVVVIAAATDNWHSQVPFEEYRRVVRNVLITKQVIEPAEIDIQGDSGGSDDSGSVGSASGESTVSSSGVDAASSSRVASPSASSSSGVSSPEGSSSR